MPQAEQIDIPWGTKPVALDAAPRPGPCFRGGESSPGGAIVEKRGDIGGVRIGDGLAAFGISAADERQVESLAQVSFGERSRQVVQIRIQERGFGNS